MPTDTSCFTLPLLAKRWRTRVSTVRRLVRAGRVAVFAVPGSRGLRVSPQEVSRFEAALAQPVNPAKRTRRSAQEVWY
jgi:hypothetical protein